MSAPTFTDFEKLYDFTVIEKAVQSFFCAPAMAAGFEKPADDDDPAREKWTPPNGGIAFYTAFQALTFQQCRPRVWIDDFSFSNLDQAKTVDVNNVLRFKAWTGSMRLGIITEPNFVRHAALRARVLAILPQLQPTLEPDGSGIAQGGVNQFLENHEIGIFEAVQCSPRIAPGDGYYSSPITINLTFGIRETKWPLIAAE